MLMISLPEIQDVVWSVEHGKQSSDDTLDGGAGVLSGWIPYVSKTQIVDEDKKSFRENKECISQLRKT